MTPIPLTNPYFEGLVKEHQLWLAKFPVGGNLRKWNQLLANDPEAALSEAGVRRFLENNQIEIEPGENRGGSAGGPDFRCLAHGKEFFVEVTNIPEQKSNRITGYRKQEEFEVRRFHPLNKALFDKCDYKVKQCGVRNAPVLLAVTTFAEDGVTAFSPPYSTMLLTGITKHFVEIDRTTGKVVSELKTSNLESAPFLCYPEDSIEPARRSISGVLLCALRYEFFVGALNPFATHPFDSSLLPTLHFNTLRVQHDTGTLHVNPKEEA